MNGHSLHKGCATVSWLNAGSCSLEWSCNCHHRCPIWETARRSMAAGVWPTERQIARFSSSSLDFLGLNPLVVRIPEYSVRALSSIGGAMAVLSSSQELLSALAANPFSTNPLADLKKNGHSLSPALQQEMKTALGNRKLAGPPAGVTAASFKGKLTFQSAPLRVAPFDPPTGSYDAMVGVRLDSGNIALDALYQAGTIPHQVALDQLLSPTDLTALGGGFIVDQPGGTISRLHITSAPTLAETTDGNTIVALRIPVQIDW